MDYFNTAGSNQFNASYTLPINPADGTLGISYIQTKSRVVEPPFNVLDIEGASRNYELTLRQPLVQTSAQEFAIGLSVSRRESDTSLLGTPYPLNLGADLQGRTRLTTFQFFQDWTHRESTSVLAARSQFSTGFGAFQSASDQIAPDSPFFAWSGQVQWVRQLAPETLLVLRSEIQLTPSRLVPLEQFSLGGQASVRGYRQSAFLTDNGAIMSAELRYPIYRAPQQNSVLHLIPFIDLGAAWNRDGINNPASNTLAAVGLGLRYQLGDRFTARLDWGIPLVPINSPKRTLQENGIYFSVIYSPF